MTGEALLVDRFGSLVTNIAASELQERTRLGESLIVEVGDMVEQARLVSTYADAEPDQPILLLEAWGCWRSP
ncbi:MAG: SAM hydroxide adenosyltransferase [Candidatus Bathyarchaeia archaeon]